MADGCIELKEFDTLFVSGHATAPFCVSWSDDDKIAVLVDDGVQIFELFPTPLSDQTRVTFIRSWIPASSYLPFKNLFEETKNNCFVWRLNKEDVYDMALNSTLTTVIEKSAVSSFIIQCCFSPLICNESYLSCLTNNGVLIIYKWTLQMWEPILNITDLWIKYCHIINSAESFDYHLLKLKLYQLKIVTMTWSNEPQLLLITGHEDGGVCIWSVDTVDNKLTTSVLNYFHIEDKLCCLSFCKSNVSQIYLLVFGTLLGTTKCVPLNFLDELTIGLENQTELWNYRDSMKPSFIKSVLTGTFMYLFTVKNHVLLIQRLDISGDFDIKISVMKWHEFSAPIIGFNSYHSDFIVGLRSHKFVRVQIIPNIKIEEETELPLKPMHNTCFHCFGLAMSKNSVIWICVSSVKVNYDAKTMRDTINLVMFVPKIKYFRSLSDLTSTGLIKQIVEKHILTTLTEISDLIELKKCELLTDPANYMDVIALDNNASPLELKLLIWETKLKIFTQSTEYQGFLTECENLLSLKWCSSKRINYLKIIADLSALQKRSLEIMEIFLNIPGRKSHSGVQCAVCNEKTSTDNIRYSSCINGHVFPRCSLSLLPCDSIPYAFCRLCDSPVHLEFSMYHFLQKEIMKMDLLISVPGLFTVIEYG